MSRITFAPVVYEQYKRSDGNYVVKMRVTFARKSRYIATSETATPSQLTRSLAIKDAELQNRLHKLEGQMRDAVSGLDMYTLSNMDVDAVVKYMTKRLDGDFKLDFFSFWEKAVADKPEGSRKNYLYSLNVFRRFVGTDTLDISMVTSRLMREFEDWLVKKHGRGARAVSMYTAAVKHVHTLARREYNNDEFGEQVIRNPFEFYSPPKQKPAEHRNVDAEVVQAMIDIRKQIKGTERLAVDAFLLSFAFMGMNAVDLYTCAAPKDGILIYNRKKTCDHRPDKAEMRVRIEPCIMPLYKEWAGKDGVHAFSYYLHNVNPRQLNASLSYGLKKYKERVGIHDKSFVFYSARHTWASLGYSARLDKSVIHDCICHADASMKVTDIYINKDWSVLWEANAKVLDLLQWNL